MGVEDPLPPFERAFWLQLSFHGPDLPLVFHAFSTWGITLPLQSVRYLTQ